jgi:hypothetical protein
VAFVPRWKISNVAHVPHQKTTFFLFIFFLLVKKFEKYLLTTLSLQVSNLVKPNRGPFRGFGKRDLKNAKQIKYHSLCGINKYLNLSKQSPKYEQSNTKDFGDEDETF